MNKVQLLWLSPIATYDDIGHAGGKTFNFYLKKFASDPTFDIRVVVFAKADDIRKIDYDHYGIRYTCILSKGNIFLNLWRVWLDIWGYFFHGISNCSYYKRIYIRRKLRRLKSQGYQPDVVILEWTEFVTLAFDVKKYFPQARIVASEHDVNFIALERKVRQVKNPIHKHLENIKSKLLKHEELNALNLCDLVVPHSGADIERLELCHISKEKQFVLTPYFQNMKDVLWRGEKNQILFFGAMNRRENYESVIWFLKNVFPYIDMKDVKFVVLGSKPPAELKTLQSERVFIPGFVEDITPFFTESKCFVAPLVLGAGIKVKVLEAMSAGLPVITNDIGIEGINAKPGGDYLHVETADEFVCAINAVFSGDIDYLRVSSCAKKYIRKNFDMTLSYNNYKKQIYKMLGKENRATNPVLTLI